MPLPLFPFQEEGARFLASRRRAGLLDEMGVGKSAQVVRAADITGAQRGLVICPAVARENWRGEFAKFQHHPRRVLKGATVHDLVAWLRGRFDVLVLSYDMAVRWARDIAAECEPIDFLAIDEGHYLKSQDTARAKAVLGLRSDGVGGLAQWAVRAWWLTGTPVPNDPQDIYTFLRFAGVMPLTHAQFTQRYFRSKLRTYSVSNTARDDMLPELRQLIGNNSLRRTLAQTGVELPPIFVTTSLVDGDTQYVRELLLSHPGLDRAIVEALRDDQPLSRLDADHVATLRRLIGEAKAIPYAAGLLHDLSSGLDKMVVFGLHRAALHGVRDYLARNGIWAVLVNGETPEQERMKSLAAFQNDPRCRVFVGNIRTAGTAVTMTSACHLDLLESDWTPAGNAQAIKRVHRISQTREVRARFITLANSFDETVNEIVAAKTAAVASLDTSR